MPRSIDLEPGALHHHGDEVLADVVNVALDGADDHLADLGRAGLGQERTQHDHAGLHRIGRHQDFRHEQDAVAKIDADDAHALDQGLGQDVVGRPAALASRMLHALDDLVRQAVIEVVMHLLDEFVVREGVEVEIAIGHFVMNPSQGKRRTAMALHPRPS